MRFLKTVDDYIAKAEEILVFLMILTIVGVNVLQIGMRLVQGSGFSWPGDVNRVLVLWLAMVGGSLATRGNEHIKVDFVSRFMKGISKNIISIAIYCFAIVACGLLIWTSAGFIKLIYGMEETLTSIPSIKLWTLQIIMPISLSIISYRFFLLILKEIVEISAPVKEDEVFEESSEEILARKKAGADANEEAEAVNDEEVEPDENDDIEED